MLLQVSGLRVSFDTPEGPLQAVGGIDFNLAEGRTLGIVGESGSGKSQTALAIMGLLADNGRASGSVRFDGNEILNLSPRKLNLLRGRRMAMVFQDPMSSLNPYLTIGAQMTEVLRLHQPMNHARAKSSCIEMLQAVHISDPAERMRNYPHELSGGMRQRVMIAMALLCDPDLLIADEPTTALDVTVQAQILALLDELKSRFRTAILLITHDLGVVAGSCDEALVMYGGQVMEHGSVDDIFYSARHPYTQGLLNSLPTSRPALRGRLQAIPGSPPDLRQLPPGCPFFARCEKRLDVCAKLRPKSHKVGSRHVSACHLEGAA